MSRDEFELWLANPATKYIFNAIRNAQGQEQAEWMRRTWDSVPRNGWENEHIALVELRTRHDALGELIDNDFETWREWNGDAATDDD